MSTHLTPHKLPPLGPGSAQVRCRAAGSSPPSHGLSTGWEGRSWRWQPRVLQVLGAVAAFAAKWMDRERGVLGREVFPGKVAGSTGLLPALRNVSANHCWHEATWREQEGFIAGPLFELQYIFLGWRQRGINQQLSLSHPIHTFSPQWCCLQSQADHSQGISLRLFLWMDHCGDMDFFWSGLGLG